MGQDGEGETYRMGPKGWGKGGDIGPRGQDIIGRALGINCRVLGGVAYEMRSWGWDYRTRILRCRAMSVKSTGRVYEVWSMG